MYNSFHIVLISMLWKSSFVVSVNIGSDRAMLYIYSDIIVGFVYCT